MDSVDGVVQRAKELAVNAHLNQWVFGNVNVTPVSEHLKEVVGLVQVAGATPEQIAAAWLHDAVEDTGVSIARIKDELGTQVAEIVDELTDPEGISALSTGERKKAQAERIKRASQGARLIKLADQISNCRMAVGPERTWDSQRNLEYVDGLRLVADACEGISVVLDEKFGTYYEKAKSILLAELNKVE